MKAALVVNMTGADPQANLGAMEASARRAADAGADLVLFPEAAVTGGLANTDDPEHDLPLGEPIPGPATDRLAAVARDRSLYIASGVLERDGRCLYDAAVLLGPEGDVVLRYRRIQAQWHGKDADADVYRQGDDLPAARTPWGPMAILICGDLFDDAIVERLRDRAPKYLLFPFDRNFSDGSLDQGRWDREEQPEYVARAALIGSTTLMVNLLADSRAVEHPAFGGALVVSNTGEVIARWPLGQPGILYAEV